MGLFDVLPSTQRSRSTKGRAAPLLSERNLSLDITGFEAAEIGTFLCNFVDPEQDVPDEPPRPAETAISRTAISGISAATASPAVMPANSA